jgi:hypothetical protein
MNELELFGIPVFVILVLSWYAYVCITNHFNNKK